MSDELAHAAAAKIGMFGAIGDAGVTLDELAREHGPAEAITVSALAILQGDGLEIERLSDPAVAAEMLGSPTQLARRLSDIVAETRRRTPDYLREAAYLTREEEAAFWSGYEEKMASIAALVWWMLVEDS